MPSFRSVVLGLRHRRDVDASQTFSQLATMYSKRQTNVIRKNKNSIITGLPKKMTSVLKANIANLMAEKERERKLAVEAAELKARERIYDTRCVFFTDDEEETTIVDPMDDNAFPLLPGECHELPINSQSNDILRRAVSIADIFGDSCDDAIEAFQNGGDDSLDCVIVDADVEVRPSTSVSVPPFSLCLSPDTDDEEAERRARDKVARVIPLTTGDTTMIADTESLSLSPLSRMLGEKRKEEAREDAGKITKSFPRLPGNQQLPTKEKSLKANLDDWLSVKRKTSVDTKIRNKHETVIVKDNDDECVIKTIITQTIITTYRKK